MFWGPDVTDAAPDGPRPNGAANEETWNELRTAHQEVTIVEHGEKYVRFIAESRGVVLVAYLANRALLTTTIDSTPVEREPNHPYASGVGVTLGPGVPLALGARRGAFTEVSAQDDEITRWWVPIHFRGWVESKHLGYVYTPLPTQESTDHAVRGPADLLDQPKGERVSHFPPKSSYPVSIGASRDGYREVIYREAAWTARGWVAEKSVEKKAVTPRPRPSGGYVGSIGWDPGMRSLPLAKGEALYASQTGPLVGRVVVDAIRVVDVADVDMEGRTPVRLSFGRWGRVVVWIEVAAFKRALTDRTRPWPKCDYYASSLVSPPKCTPGTQRTKDYSKP